MMRPNVIETHEHTGDFEKYRVTRELIGTQGRGRGVGGVGRYGVASFVFRY
jgi:hypothetical protein